MNKRGNTPMNKEVKIAMTCIQCYLHKFRGGPVCTNHSTESIETIEKEDLQQDIYKELLNLAEILGRCSNACAMLAEFVDKTDNDLVS